jgi:maltose O-acetyltransferase
VRTRSSSSSLRIEKLGNDTKTEKEKMLAGKLYNASDPAIVWERRRARNLLKDLNESREEDGRKRAEILGQLLGQVGGNVWIEPPFYCDYGSNIFLGDNVYFNCVVLDPAKVEIGSNVLFGPNVQVYTATHPLDAAQRRTGLEFAKEIKIGSDVWIGGNAVICPGVTIGDRSVIGAGSVVTSDVPEGVFAAGSPCRVIRPLVPDGQE